MDFTSLKDLAPVVVVTLIWAYVTVRKDQSMERMQRESEEGHRGKWIAHDEAMQKKDELYKEVIETHLAKNSEVLGKLTSAIENMNTKQDRQIATMERILKR